MSEHSNEYSNEPVPDSKTVPWWRVGLISAMVAFSLPTFITGIEVASVVPPAQALVALVSGSLLLTVIASIAGSIGARTRLSSYLLVKVAFGDRGAALVNLAFALSLLGWFGVNIDLFSGAVERLLLEMFDVLANPWLIELVAGVVMTVTTIYGFRAINTLSLVLVPVLIVVTVLLVSSSLGVSPLQDVLAAQGRESMSLGNAISSVVGGVIVGAVILPDITRFIRRWPGAIYTAVLSYLVVGTIVMGAGGLAAFVHANDDLLDIMIVVGLGWGAFAIVIAGSWVLNSLNLYSAVLSVEATLPRASSRVMVVGLGVLGTGAAFLDILDYFLTFLFYLSIVFVPVAGVIAVDYLFVRRSAYHDERKLHEHAISPLAILSWAAGAALALLSANDTVTLSGIAALDAMIVSAAAYFLLTRRRGAR